MADTPEDQAERDGVPRDARRALAEAEHETLRLRVRLEQLERELDQARWERQAQATLLELTRKTRVGPFSALGQRLARRARPDAVVARSGGRVPDGTLRIPLAGALLRCSRRAEWLDEVVIDGVALPGLLADPPFSAAISIHGTRGLRLRAFAGLRIGETLGNYGGVRFAATATTTAGDVVGRTELVLDPADRVEDRTWQAMELDLPDRDGVTVLTLSTDLPEGARPENAWAVWGDPVVLDAEVEFAAKAEAVVRAEATAVAARLARPDGRIGSVMAGVRRSGRRATAHPPISLLVPVHDPDPDLLRRTLDSVHAQTSPRWQLCLSDDGSRDPAVRAMLDEAASGDDRVALTRSERAAGISAATNAALALASGAYVAPLDHDDTLAPDAIARVGAWLAADPGLGALYTDNDKALPGGERIAASLKPDWSPEYLRACMYTLHLGVYDRSLVERLGGWRTAFDGAQDHDLMLRIAESGARVGHVPSIAYHWGVHPGSAAQGELAKPEAYERGRAAVDEHLRRAGVPARAASLGVPGRYRVVHDPDPGRATDLVLPVPDDLVGPALAEQLDRMVATLAAGAPGASIVVAPSLAAADAASGLAGRARVLPARAGGWGTLAAAGLEAGSAPVVVLFEELCEPRSDGWLDELGGLAAEPAIGAAAGLVTRDGRVVHAGVALPRGIPLPVYPDADLTAEPLPPELTMVTNRSAVSGVVASRREVIRAVGGIPEDADRLALVRLTLAAGARTLRVVHTPHAHFGLIGDVPRAGVLAPQEIRVVSRARAGLGDPFYNPGLWADRAAHVVPRRLQRAGLAGDAAGA